MKTSRANSFRLHRITKTGSLRKTSQSFLDNQFAALNSVNRGIKHADLSMLTGNDLNKLRVEPNQPNQGKYNSAHFNLADVRKKYDDIKKKTAALESRIDKMKQDMGKYTIFKNGEDFQINQAKTKAQALRKELQDKKDLLDVTETQKKVLLALEARHKADKVVYDQRKFDQEKRLSYLEKQLNIYRKEGTQIIESEDRAVKTYIKLEREVRAQHTQRQEHMQHLKDMIGEKQVLVQTNEDRKDELAHIAQRAIQDKDNSQKSWRKIILTHRFVSQMLRNKIDKQMQKFRLVQDAFLEIKTATGVSDGQTLVNKYMNKQIVYGQLLSKISDNQKTIQSLKNEAEGLIHEFKALQMELDVLQNIKIKSQDLHEEIKEFDVVDQKATSAYNFIKKMGQWVVRQLKKLSAIDKKNLQVQLPDTPEKLKEALNKYLQILNTSQQPQDERSATPSLGDSISPSQTHKNTRIVAKKPVINKQGLEIYDYDEQQAEHPEQEQDLIGAQRRQVLRNNEAFMHQLQEKLRAERKLLLEQMEKKEKAPKPVQVKKQEE